MRKRGDVSAAVADTSVELEAVLTEADGGLAAPPLPPPAAFHFEASNKRGEAPVPAGLARVISTSLFVPDADDEVKAWRELNEELREADASTQRGAYATRLDRAEGNVRRAHRLLQTWERHRYAWEIECEVVFAAMRDAALDALQREKTTGVRTKQITDADVKHYCCRLFSEEWLHQETRRKEVELAVESAKNLVEAWFSKCRSLQGLLAKQR